MHLILNAAPLKNLDRVSFQYRLAPDLSDDHKDSQQVEKTKVVQMEEKAIAGLLSQLVTHSVPHVILDLYFHTVKDTREQLQQQHLLPLCGCYSVSQSS